MSALVKDGTSTHVGPDKMPGGGKETQELFSTR